ncbi:TIGR03915 family putative DNA repair protein [Desulfocurvibacter africanus]|uniref:Phage SPO1 DNA polymerase-related protein n=1 Tax=Desulfocurvibacter africanus subsp. africanus str. Walvis Bay TaxID=690850 RepID=F3YUI5_DESAF|nr:TIGR03915 family putative DNA repair protein [Desulfocurvibacter africanus]EGJ48939.1 phage SPO1 DNA polymerase-related protein [Desulfocurvibacter africanus subsp. africanus str. Walvis Bay]
MRSIILAHETDFEGWRAHARSLRAAAIPPDFVEWGLGEPEQGLLPTEQPAPPKPRPGHKEIRVPRAFLDLARLTILHSDPRRFSLLYGLLWRITRDQPGLLIDLSDPVMRLAHDMARAVFRDMHRMQGFTRFRQVVQGRGQGDGQNDGRSDEQNSLNQVYLAWYEPEHHIMEDVAPFFARRFGQTPWAILTPRRSVWSDTQGLRFGPGTCKPPETPDGLEDLWRAYYSAAFIPARSNPELLGSLMPAKYRRNLPEAREIPRLLDQAKKMGA